MSRPDANPEMQVLHLICTGFLGGPERQIINHGVTARKAGLTIKLGLIHDRESSRDVLEAARERGLDTTYIEASHSYSPSIIRQLSGLLSEGHHEVIVTHGYKANILAWLLSLRRATPRIVYSRGWTRENLKVRLFHAIDRFILRRSPFVVSVSEGNRRSLIEAGVPREAITVIHNAVDVDELLRLASSDDIHPHREFEIPDNSKILVASGRFSPEKGFGDLIAAARILKSLRDDWTLLLFGDGPERELLRRQVERARLDSHVRFPGFRSNYLSYLAKADLFVLPSHSEGLPNAILESFALGVPVVATAVGGVPELVKNGQTGLLVPPAEPRTMAEVLKRAMSDQGRGMTMAGKAVSLVREKFDFEQQAEKLIRLYRKAAADIASGHG